MTGFTDIPARGLKMRLPGFARACLELARLDRPIGSWLLMFPCFWGLALSGASSPRLYALFAAGAFTMRGAGCTINDIIDRRIDSQVERTRGRPLPSGRITLRGALAFLASELALGLLILLQLDRLAVALGCASLLLVVAYPFMKRLTWWPQLFLGLAFNWGAVMGWAAATAGVAGPALLLYAGGILWTLGYDTIYAHQDKRDDARIGVKSTARRFAGSGKWPVAGFYAVFFLFVALAGLEMALGWKFYAILTAAALGCAWIIAAWKPDSPADCLFRFKANAWVGLAVFGAIVAGRCWRQ